MDDDAFDERVRALLNGPGAPALDGLRIVGVRRVDDAGFAELAVQVQAVRRLGRAGRTATVRVVADRRWRELSELDTPEAYAAHVREHIVANFVEPPREKDIARAARHRATAERNAGHSALLHARMASALRARYGAVSALDDGALLVEVGEGAWFEVHVDAGAWRERVIAAQADARLRGDRRSEGFEAAFAALCATIDGRVGGEDYIVVFRDRFWASTRIELPPVAVPRG